VRTLQPFFLSIAIHSALIALAIGLMSIVYVRYPSEEKIVLNLLTLPPSQPNNTIQEQPSEPVKPIKPIPSAPIKKPAPSPIKRPNKAAESIPEKLATQPSSATIINSVPETVSSSVPAPGANADIIQPQRFTPPPIQKAEEKYEEIHLDEIRTLLAQRLRYPKNARRLNQQGDVSVTFTLSQSGEVSQIAITKSSGFELLDNAAVSLISSCAPEFPKPSKTIRITLPIGYNLR